MIVKITSIVFPEPDSGKIPKYWMQAGLDDFDESMAEGDEYEMVKVESDDR